MRFYCLQVYGQEHQTPYPLPQPNIDYRIPTRASSCLPNPSKLSLDTQVCLPPPAALLVPITTQAPTQ